MKKLLVLVFIAALCVPCYGAAIHNILVYKFTCNFNPWIEFADSNWTEATVGTKQVAGYLLLDIDANDANTAGLNNDPTIIFYGKDGKDKWRTTFDLSEASGQIGFEAFNIMGTTNNGMFIYIDEEDEQDIVGNVRCALYGKAGKVDIGKGPKNKVYILSSMKGNVEAWAYTYSFFDAFGDMTVTLDSKYTKLANKPGSELSQGETADIINFDLHEKGYL